MISLQLNILRVWFTRVYISSFAFTNIAGDLTLLLFNVSIISLEQSEAKVIFGLKKQKELIDMKNRQKKSVSNPSFAAMTFISFCVLGFSLSSFASGNLEPNIEVTEISQSNQVLAQTASKASIKLMLNPESIESKTASLSRDEIHSIFRNMGSELHEPMLIIDWSDQTMLELPEKDFSTPEA